MRSVPPFASLPDQPERLLIRDAAAVAGRSVSWIRVQRAVGGLSPVEIDGRQAVTAASLQALLLQLGTLKRKKSRQPHLRLVVSNP